MTTNLGAGMGTAAKAVVLLVMEAVEVHVLEIKNI